jgi:MFS family permease
MSENGSPALAPAISDSRTIRAKGARLALGMLLAINLFNYIDRQVLAAVEPNIREDLLKDDPLEGVKSGLLPFAFLISYMVLSPLFGYLGDRMSRWFLIGIGVLIWSLASGGSGLAATFVLLLLTRCLVGVGEAAYGPVAPTIISDLYPVKQRGWVLAWFYMAIPVGSALGFALGSQVAGVEAMGWRWAFYLVVPPGLLLGLFCFMMRDPQRGQSDSSDGRPIQHARLADYRTILRTPSYVLNTAGMTAMTFATGGIAYWMTAYLKARGVSTFLGVNAGTAFGGMLAIAGLVATLTGGLAGDWLRRWFGGSYFLVSGVAMLLGFPAILLVIYVPFPLAWLFLFVAVFCLFFNTGPTNTILANVTHPAVRSSAFALNIFVIHLLGDAFSPFIIGGIHDFVSAQARRNDLDAQTAELQGLNIGFIVVSILVLAGGIFWLWGARYLERDTALAPTRIV